MIKREHKIKKAKAPVKKEVKSNESGEWEKSLTDQLKRIKTAHPDVRTSALKAINKTLTCTFVGKDLYDFQDELVEEINNILEDPSSREENDEAVKVLCNFFLNRKTNDDDDDSHMLFVRKFAEGLPSLTSETCTRAFGLAFLVRFCDKSIQRKALNSILDILLNEGDRESEFDEETIATLIRAASYIISIDHEELNNEEVEGRVEELLDIQLESGSLEITIAALKLILTIYDALLDNEKEDEKAGKLPVKANNFNEKYKGVVANVVDEFHSQDEQKAISDEVKIVTEFFDTKQLNQQIRVTSQLFALKDAYSILFVEALQTLTGVHFTNLAFQNPKVREFLTQRFFGKVKKVEEPTEEEKEKKDDEKEEKAEDEKKDDNEKEEEPKPEPKKNEKRNKKGKKQ